MTVPPVSNQRQTNSDCSIRQTRSSSLLTQAYNSNHFYMVRLVWFPGYVDWERRKRKLGNMRANADVRGARSFAQCVSLVNQPNSLVPGPAWKRPGLVHRPHPEETLLLVSVVNWDRLSSHSSMRLRHKTSHGSSPCPPNNRDNPLST